MPSTLFIVATPIGNLSDMTYRAVETLGTVDLVACEDTRRTDILMKHYSLSKPLLRYDEHSHPRAFPRIIEMLDQGKTIALVTDAGTPTISDPGARLTQEVIRRGHRVIPIPGACSAVTALSAAGVTGEGFVFLGFLPRKKGPAVRILREALGLGKNTVIFESPFRVTAALKVISEAAPRAHVVIARELTKIHEEFIRGEIGELLSRLENRTWKGEVVMVIRPAEPNKESN